MARPPGPSPGWRTELGSMSVVQQRPGGHRLAAVSVATACYFRLTFGRDEKMARGAAPAWRWPNRVRRTVDRLFQEADGAGRGSGHAWRQADRTIIRRERRRPERSAAQRRTGIVSRPPETAIRLMENADGVVREALGSSRRSAGRHRTSENRRWPIGSKEFGCRVLRAPGPHQRFRFGVEHRGDIIQRR